MAKNTMDDLRNHLFETIEMLKNNSDPNASPNEKISVKIAKQIAETAQVIVNSRKIEVDLIGILAKSPNYSLAKKLANSTNMISVDRCDFPSTERTLMGDFKPDAE